MKKWLLFLAIAIAVSLFVLWQRALLGPRGLVLESSEFSPREVALPKARAHKQKEVAQVWGRTPIEVTRNYLEKHRDELQLREYHDLKPQVFRSPLGSFVKYSVYQDGLPVFGLGIEFRLDRNLNILEIENEYRPVEKADLNTPNLPLADIVEDASIRYGVSAATGMGEHAADVIYAPVGDASPYRAVVVPMKNSRQTQYQMMFRASDGQLLKRTVSRAEF